MSRDDDRPTVAMDPATMKPSWPIAIASLERLGSWTVLALRLGTLALIQECVRELAMPNPSRKLIVRLRELVEALEQLPFET